MRRYYNTLTGLKLVEHLVDDNDGFPFNDLGKSVEWRSFFLLTLPRYQTT